MLEVVCFFIGRGFSRFFSLCGALFGSSCVPSKFGLASAVWNFLPFVPGFSISVVWNPIAEYQVCLRLWPICLRLLATSVFLTLCGWFGTVGDAFFFADCAGSKCFMFCTVLSYSRLDGMPPGIRRVLLRPFKR